MYDDSDTIHYCESGNVALTELHRLSLLIGQHRIVHVDHGSTVAEPGTRKF